MALIQPMVAFRSAVREYRTWKEEGIGSICLKWWIGSVDNEERQEMESVVGKIKERLGLGKMRKFVR